MADLQGNGVPTTSTIGNVDDLYTDLLTGLRYRLIRIEVRELYRRVEQDYIWELLPEWEQKLSQLTPGTVLSTVIKFEINGSTSSLSSTEIYNDLKEGKFVYCIALLSNSPDGYNGEIVCYPSYPFSASRVTLFSIGELPQYIGGKLSYRILYIEGNTVTVHDRGTIWNLAPDEPESEETT